MQTFQELKLPQALERALAAMKFEIPTPIQALSIPVALEGGDLIGCAQTGTGKTAAFGIPMITHLLANPDAEALILAPTRELAQQIEQVIRALSAKIPGMHTCLLIGGMPINKQMRELQRGPRIVIATPGRLVDHLGQRNLTLNGVQVLVLDEADRMLDMGFAPQLDRILKYLPKQRQTLLFSATLPPDIERLAAKWLNKPKKVMAAPPATAAAKITQTMIQVSHKDKNSVLLDELNIREGSVLIFARTKSRTDRLARHLSESGLPVGRIHGGRTQGQRNAALSSFRDGRVRILVATDIAARGIDISHIAHVINYDLPQVTDDYVHRIGRTARAGAEGQALSLVTPEDRAQWNEITRKVNGGSRVRV